MLIPIFFYFFFNNNIFSAIQNFKILKHMSDNLKKNYEIKVLTKNLDDLKNRQEYREIIVKDKLFLREK